MGGGRAAAMAAMTAMPARGLMHAWASPLATARHALIPAARSRCPTLSVVSRRAPPACGARNGSSAAGVLSGLDTVIFDCDGVLWNGSAPIAGAGEAIRALKSVDKRCLFLTNNSTKTRAEYAEKMNRFGIDASLDEIVSSAFNAKSYLSSELRLPRGSKVLVLGQSGLRGEIEQAGYQAVTCDDFDWQFTTVDDFLSLPVRRDVVAIVAGGDKTFDYRKLCIGSLHLQKLPHVPFVSTNMDAADNVGDGRLVPGAGPIIAALEYASGRQAVNVGKGGDWLMSFLEGHFELQPGRTAIVGDRLDTDVALGKQSGMVTILPLTGCTSAARIEELRAAPGGSEVLPDLVVDSIADLIQHAHA